MEDFEQVETKKRTRYVYEQYFFYLLCFPPVFFLLLMLIYGSFVNLVIVTCLYHPNNLLAQQEIHVCWIFSFVLHLWPAFLSLNLLAVQNSAQPKHNLSFLSLSLSLLLSLILLFSKKVSFSKYCEYILSSIMAARKLNKNAKFTVPTK